MSGQQPGRPQETPRGRKRLSWPATANLSRREFVSRSALLAAAAAGPARAQAVHQAISSRPLNVLDYGARGNGIAKDTAAIQRALDACGRSGGGTVLLPPGKTFLSGTLVKEMHHVRGLDLQDVSGPAGNPPAAGKPATDRVMDDVR